MDSATLKNKKCFVCEVGSRQMSAGEIKKYLLALKSWELVDVIKIKKEFPFKDFKESIAFVNKIAQLAEKEGHHPAILVSYNKVRVTLSTHSVGGLSENDFILAAKIDSL